jgi:hypothetical protein
LDDAIVVNPLDWEAVELSLATTNAGEHLSLPYGPAARRLYDVPVAVSVSEAPGTAHVLADQAVFLYVDNQDLQIQRSKTSNATDFSQNHTRARCEGRFATSVPRPPGVVKAVVRGGSQPISTIDRHCHRSSSQPQGLVRRLPGPGVGDARSRRLGGHDHHA